MPSNKPTHNTRKPSVSYSYVWIAGSLMATIVIAGFILVKTTKAFINDNARQAFITQTRIAAASIDSLLVKSLAGAESDATTSQYASLKNQLIAIKNASKDMRFVYLMGLKDNNIFFLVDAEPVNSEDYSPPGQIYPEPSAELIKIFESGQAFVEGPILDQWGTWISGHAPIRDVTTGQVIAIIGIDIDANTWKQTVNLHRWESIGITLLLVTLVLVYFISLWRISYANKMRHIIAAELAHTVDNLSDANQELKAFSYSVSHDLRAPLRHIHGYCEALEEDFSDKLTADGLSYLQRLQHAAKSMDRLILGLLKISRVNRQELEVNVVNLSKLAEDIINELNNENTDKTYLTHVDKNMLVFGDARLLRAVMENLISNAYKYTRHTENPHIEIGCTEDDGARVYYVKDNGAGFDMTQSDKLFEPFQRLHHADEFDGTGIGLSTVARIVKRHKGSIWAEGKVDEGAVFYFTLGLSG
jgi:signal transduction histidine kinase